MIARTDILRTASGAPRVLGLLVTLWVSLAIQPCAIAAVSEHDCPHCPSAIEAAPESAHHHGHASDESGAGAGAACGSANAECCDLGDRIAATRIESPDIDDGGNALASGAPPPDVPDVPRARPELAVPLPQQAGSTVPLHIINCAYLI